MKMKLSILLGFIVAVSFAGFAQDYDDIYYNSSKKKESKKTVTVEKKNATTVKTAVSSDNYIGTDYSYMDVNNLRDVDEYNRRYTLQDTLSYDSVSVENQADFVYTDRIRRFHNPSVIIETNDPEVAEVYYVSTSPNVNLVIGTPTYYWDSWYDWYYPTYSWRAGWYGPAWRPWYSWGWGWSFAWDWYSPIYHPHPSWGHGAPHHPGHGIGHANAGYRPTYNAGGRRPFGSYSSGNVGNGRRPAVSNGSRDNGSVNINNNGRRASVNRNSGTGSNSGGRRPAINQSSERTQSRESYNSNNSNSSRSSRGSGYSSGSGSRGGFGGSSSGGSRGGSGGGGSRGGRR